MSIRVLLADDHGVVRQGLRMYLSTDAEIEVVGEARDGAEAVDLARTLRPDVVLMDLLMPGMDGVQATKRIRREMPEIEIVALTSVLDDGAIVEAIEAGAVSYLLKNAESAELRNAIKAAAGGRSHFSAVVANKLMEELRSPETSFGQLTERETEVLRQIAAGRSNKEIGQELSVAEQTVKSHVSHILRKLGLSTRTQAALYAREKGLASQGGSPTAS